MRETGSRRQGRAGGIRAGAAGQQAGGQCHAKNYFKLHNVLFPFPWLMFDHLSLAN